MRPGLIMTSSLSCSLTTLPFKLITVEIKPKDIKLAFFQVPDLLTSLCKCQERMRLKIYAEGISLLDLDLFSFGPKPILSDMWQVSCYFQKTQKRSLKCVSLILFSKISISSV